MQTIVLKHSTLPLDITCEKIIGSNPSLPYTQGYTFANTYFIFEDDLKDITKTDKFILKCLNQDKNESFFNSLPQHIRNKGREHVLKYYGVINVSIALILISEFIPIDIRKIWQDVFQGNNKPFYIKYGLPSKWYVKLATESIYKSDIQVNLKYLLGDKITILIRDIFIDMNSRIFYDKYPQELDNYDQITLEEYIAVYTQPPISNSNESTWSVLTDTEQLKLKVEELEKKVNDLIEKSSIAESNTKLLNTF